LDVDECPLKAWRKCYEDGYSSIRKELVVKQKKATIWTRIIELFFIDIIIRMIKNKIKPKQNKFTDYEAYNILYKTFVQRIGHDKDFQSYLDNIKAYNLALVDYINSRRIVNGVEIHDRKKRNKINVLKAKIERFEKNGDDTVSIAKTLNRLSKMQGVTIKESDLTVLRYFELIKDFKQWQKES